MTEQVVLQDKLCLGDPEVDGRKIPRYNSKKNFAGCGEHVPLSD